ncbi:hypothetical protein CDAR_573711 [Caerostris darwini]|uniref:Uncharacterized protein n=1 Tax=Caerostris darwini TaxID=1538125 RepID=A0AAV4MCK5_9ARAC|nr:hypothetical protein CDAR_573711 [Caerostris darwini]
MKQRLSTMAVPSERVIKSINMTVDDFRPGSWMRPLNPIVLRAALTPDMAPPSVSRSKRVNNPEVLLRGCRKWTMTQRVQ